MHEMTIHMTMYYTPTAKTVELKKKGTTCKNATQWLNVHPKCFTKNPIITCILPCNDRSEHSFKTSFKVCC